MDDAGCGVAVECELDTESILGGGEISDPQGAHSGRTDHSGPHSCGARLGPTSSVEPLIRDLHPPWDRITCEPHTPVPHRVFSVRSLVLYRSVMIPALSHNFCPPRGITSSQGTAQWEPPPPIVPPASGDLAFRGAQEEALWNPTVGVYVSGRAHCVGIHSPMQFNDQKIPFFQRPHPLRT